MKLACVHICACAYACVRACVHACVRACVRARVRVWLFRGTNVPKVHTIYIFP